MGKYLKNEKGICRMLVVLTMNQSYWNSQENWFVERVNTLRQTSIPSQSYWTTRPRRKTHKESWWFTRTTADRMGRGRPSRAGLSRKSKRSLKSSTTRASLPLKTWKLRWSSPWHTSSKTTKQPRTTWSPKPRSSLPNRATRKSLPSSILARSAA